MIANKPGNLGVAGPPPTPSPITLEVALGERTCQGAVVSLTAPGPGQAGFSEVLGWVCLGGAERDTD